MTSADREKWVRRGRAAAYWMTSLMLVAAVVWMVLEMARRFG